MWPPCPCVRLMADNSMLAEECGYLAARPVGPALPALFSGPVEEGEARRLLDNALGRAVMCRGPTLANCGKVVAKAMSEIAAEAHDPAPDGQPFSLEPA